MLRNKFIFYLGHLTNFYDIRVLDLKPTEPYFAYFERGRDPDVDQPEYCHRHSNINVDYPPYTEVVDYIKKVREQVISHILKGGYCFRTLCSIEHEIMHQETLFYMLRMTESDAFVDSIPSADEYTLPKRAIISIPKRKFIQGTEETFVWDNESPKHEVEVEAFKVDNLPITWEDMKEFLTETGLFKTEIVPNLNSSMQLRIAQNLWVDFEKAKHLPAWVCLKVAREYLEWIKATKGIKARIMTESEFDSLAITINSTKRGNINFKHHHAMPIGFYNDYSEDGVGELFGNGWELTSTNFLPFEGFKPMDIYGEYSQDFFTEDYFVIKGASPFTSDDITRKSFRNWFQYNYPYHLSKFRLVYEN